MENRTRWLAMIGLAMVLLASCGSSAATKSTSSRGASELSAPAVGAGGGTASGGSSAAPASQAAGAAQAPISSHGDGAATGQTGTDQNGNGQGRQVIKNGAMSIDVDNLTAGINLVTDIAARNGGYLVESKRTEQSGQRAIGTVSFAVPVDHFEQALQDLRSSAKKVVDEQVSGQDVTQEYVDLKSQIDNLEATRARVRQFLDQAKNVDEALRVNNELTTIEGQLEQLKGRMQFLTQRAAFSTITVQLRELVPSEQADQQGNSALWQPARTIKAATMTLRAVYQALFNLLIWVGIVGLPVVGPVLLLLFAARAWSRGRSPRSRTQPTPGIPGRGAGS